MLDQRDLVGSSDEVDADGLAEPADEEVKYTLVSTQTRLWSARRNGSASSRTAGSNTTSPLSHSTPPSRELLRARSRLLDVLVDAKSGL